MNRSWSGGGSPLRSPRTHIVSSVLASTPRATRRLCHIVGVIALALMSKPVTDRRCCAGSRTRPLSALECRSWLADHQEGRLDYRTGRGPRSLVVRYAVRADAVLVRVPTYNDLLQYAP